MENGERVLFVHAHPDDAAKVTGGTIATLIAGGAHVTVVTATPGENEAEMIEAMRVLGVTDHRYLGAPDARWQDRVPRRYRASSRSAEPTRNAPDSLLEAPFGEVSADIAAVISSVAPTVVVSYNEWGGSGHPDHIRVHQAARRAAEVMNVAFYAVEPDDSAASPTISTDVTAVLDRKRAAIAAHASQLTVSGDGFTTVSGERGTIASVESFRRVREPEEQPFSWRGLSLGTKISTSILALVLGGATGLLMTAAHQSALVIGTVPVPWGIVVALVSSTALIAGFRIAFDTRVLPALAALGLLVVAAILASPTRGGSVVVPANLSGVLWTFVPPAVTFIVLAWPRIRRAPAGRIEPVPAVKGSSIQ